MSKLSVFTFAAIFIILYFKSVASAEVDEKRKDEAAKYSPFWFGPRIGRRKRNLIDESYENADNENVEELLDFIRKSPWTIMLFNHGRGHIVNYNPKFSKESPDGINEADLTEVVERSMFAPRLGRSMFAPRLGRAMFAPRLGRAEGEMELE
ncbi:uncharacterized protein [Leptinotarsa decemlineata]|uniref:uncharacterized protein n=1 Tax=Leptinotarsa decemlineata TaxID=7539 RepID=UPI000C253165|nr:uncharacterized protein LOC111508666 [Leptinotarsa decemlineata]